MCVDDRNSRKSQVKKEELMDDREHVSFPICHDDEDDFVAFSPALCEHFV